MRKQVKLEKLINRQINKISTKILTQHRSRETRKKKTRKLDKSANFIIYDSTPKCW